MIYYISINSKKRWKLSKRYKLLKKRKQEIIKGSHVRSENCSGLNRVDRKIEVEDLITNKNKQL